ncbi:hypothetical protein FACS1894170_08950 [Planctomycetales bacterium]|nr:hypothetical protein FACS1894170_08950 [Planctomycetales bacterium]
MRRTMLPSMPMYEDGSHAEIVLSPSSILSRNNPSVVAELALAKKTGKPYKMTDFESDESLVDFVERELKANEVDPGATIIDPKTGQPIRNLGDSGIGDGYLWTMKLHHTSEKKGGDGREGGIRRCNGAGGNRKGVEQHQC